MNGRVYDPYLARFISADPFIQEPTNSQSLNRYSYTWNNPVNGVDPSGYFLKGLFNSVKGFLQDSRRSIYSAGACVAGGFYGGPAGCGAAVGAYNAYAIKDSSGSTSQALRAGVITGVTAYFAQSVQLNYAPQSVNSIVASGFVQGTSSVLQGGNFFQGFASGAINAGIGLPDNPVAATLVSAAVGGTTSVISGGKFTNGAVNAAYFYVLGEVADSALSAASRAVSTNMQVTALTVDLGGPSYSFTSSSSLFFDEYVPFNQLPLPARTVLQDRMQLPDGRVTVFLPDGYIPTPAENGKGIVFRQAGSFGNANIIRIGFPNKYTPYTYIRYYNSYGLAISPYSGRQGSNDQTHYRLNDVELEPR